MTRLSANSRLFIASLISAIIILTWQILYINPMVEDYQAAQAKNTKSSPTPIKQKESQTAPFLDRNAVVKGDLSSNNRVTINSKSLSGTIDLQGAKIDDLILKDYKTSLNPNSPDVVLFSPTKTQDVYYAEFGWLSEDALELPDSQTIWQSSSKELTESKDLLLSWSNSQGIKFIIKIKLDEKYMFDIEQRVVNNSGKEIALRSFALISRAKPTLSDNAVIFEGPIGVNGGTLFETSYDDVADAKGGNIQYQHNSWIGFSDKYWLSALIPQDYKSSGDLSYYIRNKQERFQASILSSNTRITKGQEHSVTTLLFAGAKELTTLDSYSQKFQIPLFDRAVDFGALYFITKPIFQLLSFFYEKIGNFGLAILLLTVVIKLLLFPLAQKGFRGMNRLKDLQPKMTELKEKYKDQPQEFQKQLLELYRKEKVNPMAGCLPILLQIPIFFALYKVLYVTIEMRHAPFFGWIHDLSAPDPLTFTNLFGLIPWDPPLFLHIGIFPVLMAITMYLQQKLSPEPTDPTQAQVMKLLPIIFLFMFASFPSGLVIYWTWSNCLSILQQVALKRMEKPKRTVKALK